MAYLIVKDGKLCHVLNASGRARLVNSENGAVCVCRGCCNNGNGINISGPRLRIRLLGSAEWIDEAAGINVTLPIDVMLERIMAQGGCGAPLSPCMFSFGTGTAQTVWSGSNNLSVRMFMATRPRFADAPLGACHVPLWWIGLPLGPGIEPQWLHVGWTLVSAPPGGTARSVGMQHGNRWTMPAGGSPDWRFSWAPGNMTGGPNPTASRDVDPIFEDLSEGQPLRIGWSGFLHADAGFPPGTRRIMRLTAQEFTVRFLDAAGCGGRSGPGGGDNPGGIPREHLPENRICDGCG